MTKRRQLLRTVIWRVVPRLRIRPKREVRDAGAGT